MALCPLCSHRKCRGKSAKVRVSLCILPVFAMPSPVPSSEQQVALVQMLFVQHTAALRGFVHALMPDFARADDIVQETFLTVTKKAGDFEPGTNFLGWACSIARFKVMEAGRKAQRSTSL